MPNKEKKRAGKPAFFSKPMKRINVMLDSETVKFYTEQGKGNLSEGIRQYWRGVKPPTQDLSWVCGKCKTKNADGVSLCGFCDTPRLSG